jgi:hypothetical protein
MWQAWKMTELLIDRDQIVQVTDDEVVVKDARNKATEKLKRTPQPVIENPFRHAPVECASAHEK